MKRLEVRGAVRPTYGSLGVKRLNTYQQECLQTLPVGDGSTVNQFRDPEGHNNKPVSKFVRELRPTKPHQYLQFLE